MSVRILWAVGARRPIATCYVLKTNTAGAGARLRGVKEGGKKWRFLRGQLLVWEIGWKEEIYIVVQGALNRVFNKGPQNPAGWFLKHSYKYMVTEIGLYSFICSFIHQVLGARPSGHFSPLLQSGLGARIDPQQWVLVWQSQDLGRGHLE